MPCTSPRSWEAGRRFSIARTTETSTSIWCRVAGSAAAIRISRAIDCSETTGPGDFEDVTEGSGAGDRGYGMGVTTGDYDSDGLTDLYVTNVGPNALLRNRGGLAFEDVSRRADVAHDGWGTSCAFVDTDGDGDLDLYVANYIAWSPEDELQCRESGMPDYCSPNSYQAPAADVLYENQGDGRFLGHLRESGDAHGFREWPRGGL